MEMQSAETGQAIYKQGEKVDCCHIIQSGAFTVSIYDQAPKQLRSKDTFGELALLYKLNRTATITCSQQGTLWMLDERCFRQCMEKLRDAGDDAGASASSHSSSVMPSTSHDVLEPSASTSSIGTGADVRTNAGTSSTSTATSHIGAPSVEEKQDSCDTIAVLRAALVDDGSNVRDG